MTVTLEPPSSPPPVAASTIPASPTESDRDNCFDLLRLLLAGLVLYTHTYHVGGFDGEAVAAFSRSQTIAGHLGVLGFFGLSGFLIAGSYRRSPNPRGFLRRRVLRIMPGYWACLVTTALGFAPLIFWLRQRTLADFPWSGEVGAVAYIGRNFLLHVRQGNIDGVLSGALQPGSLNGSLWSLLPEFFCYLMLLAAGMAGFFHRGRLWLAIFTTILAGFHFVHVALAPPPVHLLPTLLDLTTLSPYILAFFVGATACAFCERTMFGWGGALFFGALTVFLLRFGGFQLAGPIILPLTLLHVGHCWRVRWRHDLSYGAYIYGFPCQQVVAAIPAFSQSVVVFLGVSIALTGTMAAASWFWVERHFLSARP